MGQAVEAVEVHDPDVLRNCGPDEFRKAVVGSRIEHVYRHGKWLLMPADGGASGKPYILLMHFGMTGMLVWCEPETDTHKHDRVIFEFTAGELRYRDQRKLAGIRVVRTESEVDDLLGPLGEDAAGVSRAEFGTLVAGSDRQLKPLLMDQEVLAGLGNITVDEILWQARLHPKSVDLSGSDIDTLYRAMRSILHTSMRAGEVPPRASWLTGHRDDSGATCPRCGEKLSRDRVGGRTTIWCPNCQPAP